MREPTRFSDRRGVTLVEVVVAMVVLAVGLLALAATMAVAAQRMHDAREHMVRWTETHRRVEQLRGLAHENCSELGEALPTTAVLEPESPTEIGYREFQVLVDYTNIAGRVEQDTIVVRRLVW